MRLSATELAERSGCSTERVAELVELGIVPRRPHEPPFHSSDIQRVWLAEAFERSGATLADIARGIEAGRISFANLDQYFPEAGGLSSLTYDDLASALGRPRGAILALVRALGLGQPVGSGRVRADDAEMISSLVASWHMASDEELLRIARLYGDGLRRITESAVRLFRGIVTHRVTREDKPMRELEARIGAEAVQLIEGGEAFAARLHRRHLEHWILEESVARTEEALERASLIPPREDASPAIAFLDLTGYTALTEALGDEESARLAARVTELVEEVAERQGGRTVKFLGDGVMFHFSSSTGAVGSAIELVSRIQQALSVRARIGINAGPVVFREGDYFGRTVNVAARIADYARPREVLVSDAARRAAAVEAVTFEEVGEIALKGVSVPVTLYRAVARDSSRRG